MNKYDNKEKYRYTFKTKKKKKKKSSELIKFKHAQKLQ